MRFAGLFLIAIAAVPAQQASPARAESGPGLHPISALSEGLRFESELPPFEAEDIAGRTWRREDLRGKFTLIYIWHTFAARAVDVHGGRVREVVPGLPDLREVQRFYSKARRTNNIQVLTLCRDYDYTHASEYMKEKRYSFPVIADWVLIQKLFPKAAGNPPYWVIDPDARLSSPVPAWSFGRVLYEMERAASR